MKENDPEKEKKRKQYINETITQYFDLKLKSMTDEIAEHDCLSPMGFV
jgi:hypothetical protein